MSKKYHSAIVGIGNIGYGYTRFGVGFPTTHFEAYRDHPDTALIAVCDTNTEALHAFSSKFDIPGYETVEEMFSHHPVEIISVCTPDDTHASIVQTILEYGKCLQGIWCEKPLSRSLSDARAMVSACEEKNIPLLVNFTRRYDLFYEEVRVRMHELVGDIQTVSCYYSGGLVTAGSHMTDLLSFFFGACQEVRGISTQGGLLGILTFAEGRTVTCIPMKGEAFHIFEMDILGKNGRLNLCNRPFGDYAYRYTRLASSSIVQTSFLSEEAFFPLDQKKPRTFMNRALDDMIESIAKKKEPRSSGKTATDHSLEILCGLWQSAKEGGRAIPLPLPSSVSCDLPSEGGDVSMWSAQDMFR